MSVQVDMRPTEEILRDLRRNFELRRLLLVALHVLVPSFILTGVSMSTQDAPLPGLEILWSHSLILAACGVIISSAMVAHGMIRCQHGIVVNGALVNWRIYGKLVPDKLNLHGVSSGFYALAVLSLLFGLSIVGYYTITSIFGVDGWHLYVFVCGACSVLFILAVLWFASRHKSAWRSSSDLLELEEGSSQRDESSRQLHRMNSLDDTNSDIGAVFVTAMILFSTMLSTLPDLAQIYSTNLVAELAVAIGLLGTEVVVVYGILAMFLSQSMLIRLRVAMAEHISQTDSGKIVNDMRVWDPSVFERTSMLYMMLATMLIIFAMMLCIKLVGSVAIAVGFAVFYLAHSRIYYLHVMRREHVVYKKFWQCDAVA